MQQIPPLRCAPVGMRAEGSGNMSKQQIPPLRCGMTNQKGECDGKNNRNCNSRFLLCAAE